MASTGYLLATTYADDDGTEGDITNGSTMLTGTDVGYGNASTTNSGGLLSGFGFAGAGLSTGDTINGLEYQVRSADQYGDNTWYVQCGVNATTDVLADYTFTRVPGAGNAYTGTSFATFTVGGASNLLGFTGDADTLLNAAFKLAVQFQDDAAFPTEQRIAWVKVNVHYTPAGGGGISVPVVMHHRQQMAGN